MLCTREPDGWPIEYTTLKQISGGTRRTPQGRYPTLNSSLPTVVYRVTVRVTLRVREWQDGIDVAHDDS